jgi:RNA polymerase sigma-70 factor (ECF subfamily)
MRKSSRTGSARRTGPATIGGTNPGETPGDVGAAPRKPPKAGAQPLEGLGVETGDARLVERARGGDDAAFGVLVTRYERKLVRVLTRLVRDAELARDLAQETFWRVYNRLDRFDTARRFGPWLFRVGVNLGLDWLRRHGATTAAPLSIDRPRGDGLPAFDLPDPDPRLQADLAQEVQFVLARIPVTYRTILVLRDLEGFSSAEVAAIVSRREATIRWRLARARAMFRDQWERRQGATSWSSEPSRREGD